MLTCTFASTDLVAHHASFCSAEHSTTNEEVIDACKGYCQLRGYGPPCSGRRLATTARLHSGVYTPELPHLFNNPGLRLYKHVNSTYFASVRWLLCKSLYSRTASTSACSKMNRDTNSSALSTLSISTKRALRAT